MPSMVFDSVETTLSSTIKDSPRAGRDTDKGVKWQKHFATDLWWLLRWLHMYQHIPEKVSGVVNSPTNPTEIASWWRWEEVFNGHKAWENKIKRSDRRWYWQSQMIWKVLHTSAQYNSKWLMVYFLWLLAHFLKKSQSGHTAQTVTLRGWGRDGSGPGLSYQARPHFKQSKKPKQTKIQKNYCNKEIKYVLWKC